MRNKFKKRKKGKVKEKNRDNERRGGVSPTLGAMVVGEGLRRSAMVRAADSSRRGACQAKPRGGGTWNGDGDVVDGGEGVVLMVVSGGEIREYERWTRSRWW